MKDQRVTLNCERCGKEFKCSPSHAKRGRKLCSLFCSNHGIKKNTGRTRFKKGFMPWNKGKNEKTGLAISIRNCNKSKEWRSKVFERDNYACQKCGDRTKVGNKIYIEAHHIKSFSDILIENNIKTLEQAEQCYELWDINNGITLCYECHQKTKYFKHLKGGKIRNDL